MLTQNEHFSGRKNGIKPQPSNTETSSLTSRASNFFIEREEKVAFAKCPQKPTSRRIFTSQTASLLLIFQRSQCQPLPHSLWHSYFTAMWKRLFNDSGQCQRGHLGQTAHTPRWEEQMITWAHLRQNSNQNNKKIKKKQQLKSGTNKCLILEWGPNTFIFCCKYMKEHQLKTVTQTLWRTPRWYCTPPCDQTICFKYSLSLSLCVCAPPHSRASYASKAHKCAPSFKSQRACQVLLIFHKDYSWINAFNILLQDQFHDLFTYKTVYHAAHDVRVMWHASIVEKLEDIGTTACSKVPTFKYNYFCVPSVFCLTWSDSSETAPEKTTNTSSPINLYL